MSLGIGSALLDIIVIVDNTLLKAYNLQCDNSIESKSKFDEIHHNILVNPKFPIKYSAGGSCLNTLRICKWILPDSISPHIEIDFLSPIGNDLEADLLQDCMKQDGIHSLCIKDINNKYSTGKCLVLINNQNKDRSLLTDLEIDKLYDYTALRNSKVLEKSLKQSIVFYCDAFFLSINESAWQLALYIYRVAQNNNKMISGSLASTYLCENFLQLREALVYWDIVFCNESESRQFYQTEIKSDSVTNNNMINLESIGLFLSNYKCSNNSKLVLITRGSNPTLVIYNNTIRYYFPLAIKSEMILDKNGAGDAFAGGFLACIILYCYKNKIYHKIKFDWKLIDSAVQIANYCSFQCLQVSGCDIKGMKKDFELWNPVLKLHPQYTLQSKL